MVGTRTRVLTLFALAVIVTAAVLPITAGPAYADGPVAEFDWEMPARTGLDANHDGVIDARTTQSAIAKPTAGWQVNFDACMSTPSAGQSLRRFTWYVDQVLIGSPDTQTSPCGGFTYYFPEEGRYEITLEVEDTSDAEAHVIRTIVVQDFLVVALGDSFGSGQGNPDKPIPGFRFDDAEQARGVYLDRLRELGDIEDAYDETARRVGEVRSRLRYLYSVIDHEADVCNPFSPNYNFDECFGPAATAVVDATAALLTALRDLGLAALVGTLDLIEDSLQEALDAAQAAVDLAATAVTEAWEEFENREAALSPVWQNKRCNRSSIAGQAQAALELEEADPHTSVTLVHLACSGATIREGLIGPYAGVEPPPGASDLPPQVDKAASLIGGREVDAVLVSIGGNDVGFGPIVEACMFQEPCHDPPTNLQPQVQQQMEWLCLHGVSVLDEDCLQHYSNPDLPDSALEIFADLTPALPGAYNDLAAELAEAFPAVAAEPGRVYISEYPNATEDDDRSICVSGTDPFDMLPGITGEEGLWLRNTVTHNLNDFVESAATRNRWTFVGGIYDRFAGHGYCADHSWFRRIQDSFLMQGTKEGAVHPTAAGHAAYGEENLAALQGDLYATDGGGLPNLAIPRRPNPDYSSSGGGGGSGSVPPPTVARFEWTIDPDGTAHFDGCGSTGYMGVPIDRYLWPIPWVYRNGQWVPYGSGDAWVSSSCDDFTYRFTEAGEYRVVLDVLDALGHGAWVDHYLHVSDASPPSVVGVPDRVPDAPGWYSGDVTIDWQATDPAPSSGAPTDPPDTVAATAGSAVYTSAPSCDPAGNCATGTLKLSIDKTPPSVIGVPGRKPNAAGWYSDDVTIDWHAADPAPSSGAPTDPPNTIASTEGNGVAYTSDPSCDPVGNCATGTRKLSIDKTNPGVSLVGGPANGASYYFGFVPAEPTCSASDALSGLYGVCSVSGYATTVGSHTVRADAYDKADNHGSASATYTVLAWTLKGFYQPVDMPTVWNTAKNGSTVPFKFNIYAGSTELKDTADVQGFTATPATCPSGIVTTDAIEVTATGGTSLRYDTTAGQFMYNWQTPKKPGACYVVTMTTLDGSTLKASFMLK